jgi:hypothetical protein
MSEDGVLIREPVIIYHIDGTSAERLRLLSVVLGPEIMSVFSQEEVKVEFYELNTPELYYYSSGYFEPVSEQMKLGFKDEG